MGPEDATDRPSSAHQLELSETWTNVAGMPEARTDGVAVSLSDGSALLIGGHDEPEGEWTYGAHAFRYVPGS